MHLKIPEIALKAGMAHVPPAFSGVEVIVALYCRGTMRYDEVRPGEPEDAGT